MKPIIYTLNSSQADCIFIEFKDVDKFVLIDGGDSSNISPYTPCDFVQEKNIRELELLILTHLHKDHIDGIVNLLKNITVKEAVLPYPYFENINCNINDDINYTFNKYKEIYLTLKKSGTKINIAPPFQDKSFYDIGKYRLKHLYPTKYDFMPGYELIKLMQSKDVYNYKIENIFIDFNIYSNFDCSLWSLDENKNNEYKSIALLGGDVPIVNWNKILKRKNLTSKFLKASHHGMEDGINNKLVQDLKVTDIIICNNYKNKTKYKHFYNILANNKDIKYAITGKNDKIKYVIYDFKNFTYI